MANSTRSYWKNGNLGFYDGSVNTTYKTGVWADCPLLAAAIDPTVAYIFFEDFMNLTGVAIATTAMAGWTVSQSSTGAVSTSDTEQGGILLLDSASTTAAYGVQIQYTEGTLPFIPVAGQDIWFECRLAVDEYDDCEFFAGLSAVDTSIISGSDMTAANHIGFECHTDDGVLLFGGEKAGTEATPVAAATLEEDTLSLIHI